MKDVQWGTHQVVLGVGVLADNVGEQKIRMIDSHDTKYIDHIDQWNGMGTWTGVGLD